jgi:hypothetical protein
MIDQENLLKFREVVVNDIKAPSTEELSNYLHENMDLWLYVLQTLRREVELQISCQTAKFKMDLSSIMDFESEDSRLKIADLKIKHHKWRMSVLKFLTNIETKTLYVKMLISQSRQAYISQGE